LSLRYCYFIISGLVLFGGLEPPKINIKIVYLLSEVFC
jgi:hypothetical protein